MESSALGFTYSRNAFLQHVTRYDYTFLLKTR